MLYGESCIMGSECKNNLSGHSPNIITWCHKEQITCLGKWCVKCNSLRLWILHVGHIYKVNLQKKSNEHLYMLDPAMRKCLIMKTRYFTNVRTMLRGEVRVMLAVWYNNDINLPLAQIIGPGSLIWLHKRTGRWDVRVKCMWKE